MNARVGAIPVSGEIQEWFQSLIVHLNWLNELAELVSEYLCHRQSNAKLPHWTRKALQSLLYVNNHFLFDTSVFSLALIFHCSASRHTGKQYLPRGQIWENMDCTKNQSDCRIRFRAL